AAQPRARQEVLRRQNLPPQLAHPRHLGEETVAAEVEPPSVTLHGLTDATDRIGRLHHRYRHVTLAQFVRGGEAGRAGPDHHYGVILTWSHRPSPPRRL